MRSYISFYLDAFRLALQAIFAHKLRAFLTLIGIIIGVASVVVVGASINGLNAYVLTTISKMLGANHFMIARIATNGPISDEQWEKMNRRNKQLYLTDFEWLRERCKQCAEVGADIQSRTKLEHAGQELFGTGVLGVTSNMGEIENKELAEGRFIAESEEKNASLVMVIGMDVADKFFPGANPIGQELKVNGCPLRIIGIEARRGSMFGNSLDNHLYMPITTYGHIFGRRQSVRLHGSAHQQEQFQLAMDEARMVMRNRHKLVGEEEDDFGLVNTGEIKNQVDQFTGTIALVVTPVTLLSLLVGGIGVMNIMLVSVTERTREIGVRKALGATRRDIVRQFLFEAMTLTFLGGLLGVLLAIVVSYILMWAVPAIPATIPLWAVVTGVSVSILVGLIFGVWPARKASRLDPIECLRYE